MYVGHDLRISCVDAKNLVGVDPFFLLILRISLRFDSSVGCERYLRG